MLKKSYSLDYEIYRAEDRTIAIEEILENLEETPSKTDLEQMADYILFGKDEAHLSEVDRRKITQPTRKFGNWKRKSEKDESLNALLETPEVCRQIEDQLTRTKDVGGRTRYKVYKPQIRKPTYDKNGNMTDPGDTDIPGMVELQANIARLQERYDMYAGKIPPNEWVRTHPLTKYQVWKFNHMLIDVRRHQYYLKDAYKPTLKFFSLAPPPRIDWNFDDNTGLWLEPTEWCARKRNPKPFDLPQPALEDVAENEEGKLYWQISENVFDFENPNHIRSLLDNYVKLLEHSYDKPGSNTRLLLMSLEQYIELANLTDTEQFVLEQRVAHRNSFRILELLREENITISEAQLRTLSTKTIPGKIAAAATKHRLLCDFKHNRIEGLKCSKCGRMLPKDPFFFSRSREKRTGYCSQCKECQKASRDMREKEKREGKNQNN